MRNVPSPTRMRPSAQWRLLVVGLLLAALAGWQGWHCANDAVSSPSASPAALALGAHHPAPANHDHPGETGLAGACLSVLAAFAGALVLLARPGRPAAVPAAEDRRILPPYLVLGRAPALSALGLLRI